MIEKMHIGYTGSVDTSAMRLICILLLWSAAVTDSAPAADQEKTLQIALRAEQPKLFASAEEALVRGILAFEQQPIAPDPATLKVAGDAVEIFLGDSSQDYSGNSGDVGEKRELETSDRWPYVDPSTMKVGWANVQGLPRGLSS